MNGSRPKPWCSAADLPSSGTSAAVFGVQEWRRPPVGGDVLAAEASYAQTAAASGWKGWHLLTAFLSLSSLPLSGDTAHPGGGGHYKVKMAALSQQRVHLMFSQERRRAKNN